MTLVDTSVWIDHFKHGNKELMSLLEADLVCVHPHVIGELACGNIRNRDEVLHYLKSLPTFPVATDDEVLAFVEIQKLHGRGIGWVDAHLLASVRLSGDGKFFTLDKKLL